MNLQNPYTRGSIDPTTGHMTAVAEQALQSSRPELFSVLGKYGMAHPLTPEHPDGPSALTPKGDSNTPGSSVDERMRLASQAKQDRLEAVFRDIASSSPEGDGGEALITAFSSSYALAGRIFGNIEVAPDLPEIINFVEQLRSLQPLYEAMNRKKLEPMLVFAPEGLSVDNWKQVVSTATADPELNKGDRLKEGITFWGGAQFNSILCEDEHGNPLPVSWVLHVMAGTEEPQITGVTSYGYTDNANSLLSEELNTLLEDLGHPGPTPRELDENRSNLSTATLIQPDVHPTTACYLTAGLMRIAEDKDPFDTFTYSWLDGVSGSGTLPRGDWLNESGKLSLGFDGAGRRIGNLGVRVSGRGIPRL